MEKLLVSFQIECTKQRLKIFQLSFVDWFESGKTPSTLLEATRDRAGDGEVVLVGIKTPAVEQSVPVPQTTTVPPKILPPVDTLLENEIWQYRYPPFDNIFNNPADDESDSIESETLFSGRSPRFNIESLPSYVIGILDPAELVDGLFQQRPFGTFRSDAFNKRNSVRDTVDFNDADFNFRNGKSVLDSSPNTVFSVPRIILESDDRWVWRSLSS